MNRGRGNTEIPRPKPVDKITLSEKHTRQRFLAVVFLLLFGVGMIVYGCLSALSGNSGWREIEADSASEMNCSGDFVFLYDLDAEGIAVRAQYRQLSDVYTEAAEHAYRIFNNDQSFEGVSNIYDINHHPNEVITVDEALYGALSAMQEAGGRYLYLAPVYSVYDNLFYCSDDSELVNFDPALSPEVAADFAQILPYVNDPEAVDLELLGGSQVRLHVSQDYLAFAEADGIEDFIDFYWMKNAFITDYLADTMIENGYTYGSISSYDGFMRNLDDRDTSYSFNIYDRVGADVYGAAVMKYSGKRSIVYLRDYPVNSLDFQHYYELENGEIRTPYLSLQDGLPRSAARDLVCYSQTAGCAEILLDMLPVYLADQLDREALNSLTERDIYSIYCDKALICYNDKNLVLDELYKSEEICYTKTLVGDE